jgi:hypothetical protein
MTLTESLIVTITDKLIIGMIVLAIGYSIRKKFESFKEKQGFESSINNKRVEAIGEVLARVTDYEYVLRQVALLGVEVALRSSDHYREKLKECTSSPEMTLLLQSMKRELDNNKEENLQLAASADDLLQRISVSREKHSLAEEAINKNHFWIGKSFYFEMTDRMNKWSNFLECIKHFDKDKVDRLYLETISEMRDVFSFVQQKSNQ